MARFTLPRDIYYGEDALESLKALKGKKAMVVIGGSSMKKFGFLDKAMSYLHEAGFETSLFDGVEPDPSVETVMRGAKAMSEFEPDWIVAIGGGSPIDAAKAMWAFYEYPDVTFDTLCVPFNFPTLRTKSRFCAISSTSGTATEVTAFSVITDYSKGIKYPLADFNITPDVAIVDPSLAATMPKTLIAHTGMDALTHAVEAYVSLAASNYSDALAMKAIEMVVEYLPDSYSGDMSARKQMHDAQCLAGMAFSNALLGIVHSMAHKTGAAFKNGKMAETHLPHGCANAIYLPFVIQYNAHDARAEARYADIAKQLGEKLPQGNSPEERLCALIDKMNSNMGIPHTLKEFGVEEDEFLSKVQQIAENAVADACTGSNPREIDAKTMAELLKCTYYGTKVDF